MAMATNPLEALLSGYRHQVLALLFLQPEGSFHVREIARRTGVPAGSLHRELRRLAEAGLLIHESVGNRVRYRANQSCPIFPELAGIFRKTAQAYHAQTKNELDERLVAGLAVPESLGEFCRGHAIKRLRLFGSAARGDAGPESDIDLLVEFEPGRAPSLIEMVRLKDALSEMLGGRRVDLATPSMLNNPYRRREILKDLKELYAA